MFNTTAAAFSGTAATPVVCNSKVWFVPSALTGAPMPLRVSRIRVGFVIGVNPEPAGK